MYKNITRTFYGGPQFEHFGARSRGAFGKFHMIWCQPIHTGSGSMLSAIISTHESERVLVPTLAALVPAATAGLLGEVIVADVGHVRSSVARAAGRAAEGGGGEYAHAVAAVPARRLRAGAGLGRC